jgi:hypothetical protein
MAELPQLFRAAVFGQSVHVQVQHPLLRHEVGVDVELLPSEKARCERVIVLVGLDFELLKDRKDFFELFLVIEIDIEATLACRTCG